MKTAVTYGCISPICAQCVDRARELFASRAGSAADPEQVTTPWQHLSDDELLARLPEVAAAGQQVESHLAEWVHAARDRSVSWSRIGAALSMTRQSAWERFSETR